MKPSREQRAPRLTRTGRRALLAVPIAAALFLVAMGAYLGFVGIQRSQARSLPAPTGPYAVGRAMYDWTNGGLPDPLAPEPGHARELSVWLWYPAERGTARREAPYAPGAWADVHLSGPAGWFEGGFAAVRDHAVEPAPIARGRFPVVVLEPGLGLEALLYTTLAEDLASQGYLVAAVTPTYSADLTVLDGRVVEASRRGNPGDAMGEDRAAELVGVWATDAQFVAARVAALDRTGPFAGHVEGSAVAYIGHSLGGAASLEACSQDPRCAGAVNMDGAVAGGVVRTGLARPVLLMGSQDSCVTGWCSAAGGQGAVSRQDARRFLAASTGPLWDLEIRGTEHFDFSDYAAFYLAWPLSRLVPVGPLNGDRALQISDAYVSAFVGRALEGRQEPLLGGAAPPFAEVRVLTERR